MVGVGMGLQQPFDRQATVLNVGNDRVGRLRVGPTRFRVEIEHRVDDCAAVAFGVFHDVRHGKGGFVEEGFHIRFHFSFLVHASS